MSCPAAPRSLKDRLDDLDGPVELPRSFYILTLLMILIVTSIPLIYRKLWLFFWDLITDIREDLSSGEVPAECRQIGQPSTRKFNMEKLETEDIPGQPQTHFLYLIKSTAPIEVQSIETIPTGLENGPLFSFAQLTSSLPDLDGKVDHSWQLITQSSHTRLSLVRTELWVPEDDADEDNEWVKSGGCVMVRFPFIPDIPFNREGLRALLVIWLCRLQERSWSAEPMVHFKLPLFPTKERTKAKEYTKEPPIGWNMQSEVSEETWARLKFHLGVSNPLTIFRVDKDLS